MILRTYTVIFDTDSSLHGDRALFVKWDALQAFLPAIAAAVPKNIASLAFPQYLTLYTTRVIKNYFLKVLKFWFEKNP